MIAAEDTTGIKVKLENHETRIEHVEEWKKVQNSKLERINDKLDKQLWFLLTLLGGIATSLFLQLR